MTITSDYSVFLKGCIKNNAVDYKILYNNKCKENNELTIKADAENTANIINKLNEEFNIVNIKYEETKEILKNKKEIIDNIIEKENKEFYKKRKAYAALDAIFNDFSVNYCCCCSEYIDDESIAWNELDQTIYKVKTDDPEAEPVDEIGIGYICQDCWEQHPERV